VFIQPAFNTSDERLRTSSEASAKIGWASETEWSDGQIPANIISDPELGVGGNEAANNNSFDKRINLNNGSMLLAPASDLEVCTPFGSVNIKAGSVVLVLAFSEGMAVYDLHDDHMGSIEVKSSGGIIPLYPGMNLTITSTRVSTFEQINPAQLFAYRHVSARDLDGNHRAFSSEFYVPTAMRAVVPIKQMLDSKNPKAKRIVQQLLKTAAATMQLKQDTERFQLIPRPMRAAWNQ
jgi:hypothetical protein